MFVLKSMITKIIVIKKLPIIVKIKEITLDYNEYHSTLQFILLNIVKDQNQHKSAKFYIFFLGPHSL